VCRSAGFCSKLAAVSGSRVTGPYLDALPGSGKEVTPFLIGCGQTPVRDKIDTGDRISDLHARRYPVVGQAVRSSQIFCHISRDKPTVSVTTSLTVSSTSASIDSSAQRAAVLATRHGISLQ
jgi:hypothetical protein